MSNGSIDEWENTCLQNFSQINSSWNTLEVQDWNGHVWIFSGGDFTHLLGVVDGIIHCSTYERNDGWGCGHSESANAIGFCDGAVSDVKA